MNVNIYLEDALAKQLAKRAELLGQTRNALIRMAIREFLSHEKANSWPSAVRTFHGVPEFPPFEDERLTLKPPKEDPLA